MTCFSLIRHAPTTWNLEKRLQGSKDLSLADQGRKEARAWARRLSDTPFDLVLASPLTRAVQTAQIIANHLCIDTGLLSGMEEQNFGNWEGKRLKSLRKQNPDSVAALELKGWLFCPPKGESRAQVLNRGLAAIKKASLAHPEKHILVVTHNTMIKCLLYHCLGRNFMPDDPQVIRHRHLHRFEWESKLTLTGLNALDLTGDTILRKGVLP